MDSKRTNVWFILYVIPNTPQNVLAHPSRRQIRKVCHVFLNFIPDEEYLHVVFPSFHSEFRISSWARSTYLKTELSYPHSLIALAPMARNILSRFRLSSVLFFELLFSVQHSQKITQHKNPYNYHIYLFTAMYVTSQSFFFNSQPSSPIDYPL